MRKLPRWLLVVAIVLLALRALTPVIAVRAINWAIDEKLTAYQGELQDVDLALYRGAYVLENLSLRKVDAPESAPDFLHIEKIDMSLAWRALLRGRILADLTISEPTVNVGRDAFKKKKPLDEPKKNWRETLESIVPIDLERLEVRSGKLNFFYEGFSAKDPVSFSNVNFTLSDMRTRDAGLSPFSFDAVLQQQAGVLISGKMDFLSKVPKLDADFRLEKLQLTTINEALMKTVPLNVTRGVLSVYGEAVMKGKAVDGYAKFFLKDADIITMEKDLKGGKRIFAEFATGFANWFLENEKKDLVAFRLPFLRRGTKWKFELEKALSSALENRSEPLEPKIENKLSLN